MTTSYYNPSYTNSHALVIGINKYKFVSPLAFAVSDATAIAETLRENHGFSEENIALLTDENATREAIMSAYLSLSNDTAVRPDDRLFVFFAGHGHTVSGRRGETGFLVPVDGDVSNIATLIKWGELTGSADLIAAKHVFFLMDACYGGLAVTRKTIPPGSMRLLEDMLQRYSRQVLTAGKADEPVSDGGGTRPGHSIFTSHVLDALEGGAAATEGVITANGLMAYVYQKVGCDPLSNQTPHYGFLEGDGDFVFSPLIQPAAKGETKDNPKLIQTPAFTPPEPPAPENSPTEQFKQLISNPADKIRLDDYVTAYLRQLIYEVALDKISTQGPYSPEEFANRLKYYERAVSNLQIAVILIARWGTSEQIKLLQRIFSRLAEAEKGSAGLTVWLNLAWYPVQLLMYAGGIAALSEGRFDALRVCLLTPVARDNRSGQGPQQPILIPTMAAMTDLHNVFKTLPGLERRYTPRSDHLFQALQPVLEDQLFLGRSYEQLFDQFESMLALTYADQRNNDLSGRIWGPPGRFAWKHSRGYDGSPYNDFVESAKQQGAGWPALIAGFFQGDPQRFATISDSYSGLLAQIGWW